MTGFKAHERGLGSKLEEQLELGATGVQRRFTAGFPLLEGRKKTEKTEVDGKRTEAPLVQPVKTVVPRSKPGRPRKPVTVVVVKRPRGRPRKQQTIQE
jgi:hypothetical protein